MPVVQPAARPTNKFALRGPHPHEGPLVAKPPQGPPPPQILHLRRLEQMAFGPPPRPPRGFAIGASPLRDWGPPPRPPRGFAIGAIPVARCGFRPSASAAWKTVMPFRLGGPRAGPVGEPHVPQGGPLAGPPFSGSAQAGCGPTIAGTPEELAALGRARGAALLGEFHAPQEGPLADPQADLMTPPVSPQTPPEAYRRDPKVMFRYPSPETPPAAWQRAVEMGIIEGPLTPPELEEPLISGEGIVDLTQDDDPEGHLSKRARTGDHPGSSLPSDPPTDLDMTSRDYEDLITFEASEKAYKELHEESENRHVIFDPEVEIRNHICFQFHSKCFCIFKIKIIFSNNVLL